jgi:tetratricopeptide (TPR) repeat protein
MRKLQLYKIILVVDFLIALWAFPLYSQSVQSILLENDILIIETEGIAFLGSGITEDNAKTLAISDAKRNSLEYAGTYLESHSEVLNFIMEKDEIITYTGGLLRIEVLQEERTIINEMFAFQVIIEATIDMRLLNERITEIRSDEKLKKQLEIERERNRSLEAKIAELQSLAGDYQDDWEVEDLVNALTASEWFEKGYYSDNNNEKIEYYTRAIELDPIYGNAYNNRGMVYDDLGRYDKAIRDYTKAIELDPYEAYSYYNRGYTLDNLGRYIEAIDDYTKAIELDPYDADIYYNRAISFDNLSRYDEAIDDYTKAIELNPNYINAYYNRALSFDNLSRYDEAIDDYSKVLEMNPHDVNTYFLRGIAYDNLEIYDEAINDYTNAIEIDPYHADAYYNRGLLFELLYQYERAAADFNTYLEIQGNKDGDAEEVRQWIRDLGYTPVY